MVQFSSSMCEALDSIPSMTRKQNKTTQNQKHKMISDKTQFSVTSNFSQTLTLREPYKANHRNQIHPDLYSHSWASKHLCPNGKHDLANKVDCLPLNLTQGHLCALPLTRKRNTLAKSCFRTPFTFP